MVKALPIPGLRADMPYGLAAAATIRVRADELVAFADGVLDVDRIERVHGMRVATRRLRAVLEIYAPCFPPDELKRTLREVKGLADALGARRDPDVQLEGLDRFAATLPEADRPGIAGFMSVVRADQEAGNATLADALQRLEPATLRARIEVLVRAAEDAVPPELRLVPDDEDGDRAPGGDGRTEGLGGPASGAGHPAEDGDASTPSSEPDPADPAPATADTSGPGASAAAPGAAAPDDAPDVPGTREAA